MKIESVSGVKKIVSEYNNLISSLVEQKIKNATVDLKQHRGLQWILKQQWVNYKAKE